MIKTLLTALTGALSRLRGTKSISTCNNYQTTINVFTKLMPSVATASAQPLDSGFIAEFASKLRRRGNCENSVRFHIRNLRALHVVAFGSADAFAGFSTRPDTTIKRSLNVNQFRSLLNYEPPTKAQQRAKDVFLLAFYLNGMAFVDLAYLPRTAYIRDRHIIVYKRHKTDVQVCVHITDKVWQLMKPFLSTGNSPFLFSFLDGAAGKDSRHKRYRAAMKSINNALHKIGEALGFSQVLTLYVARHTFASMALEAGCITDNVRLCMGHTSIRTTEIYLRRFSHKVETAVGHAVANYINGS